MVAGCLQGQLQSPVEVVLTGGVLVIEWQGVGKVVYMTGQATWVFDGYLDL